MSDSGTASEGAGDVASVSESLVRTQYVPVARIAKISVSDYRAFPSGPPCEIDLGADGKNLLLYGENGSGKSSLARALRDLFNARNPPASYEPSRNVFTAGEDGTVAVQFTAGVVPAELRWEFGEAHPKTTQGQAFFEFASRCLFLDYRDLLRTSFGHRSGPPNLFNLLMETVLESLPVLVGGRQVKLGEVYRDMTASKPARHNRRPLRRADGSCAQLNAVLAAHLPEVVSEANRIFEKLGQPGTKFTLTANPVSYDRISRSFAGCRIEFETELFGHKVAEPQHFLNEARLTALALAIYLGAARCAILPAATSVGGALPTRLLVLDDVLIGLDLANRLPLLRVLTEDFDDWQIILLTHDATWFDMASEVIDEKRWATCRLHVTREPETKRERPVLIAEKTYLESAEMFLAAGDYPAAGVYLRMCFEALLRDFCQAKHLLVPFKRELRELSSEDFWPRVKEWKLVNGAELIGDRLCEEIEFCRRFILNPLCHDAQGRPLRPEVETALSALVRLKSLLKAETEWRRDWEQKKPKGQAIPRNWHLLMSIWMLDRSPAVPNEGIAAALRLTFEAALTSFCMRNRVPVSYTCDQCLSTSILWENAKVAGGLASSQPTVVATIDANASWLVADSPSRAVFAAVPRLILEQVRDAFRGTSAATNPVCVLDTV